MNKLISDNPSKNTIYNPNNRKNIGHRQRLRERFLKQGIDGFTDSDVIEFLLTLGTPRKDCKQEARALLREFGSLSAVMEASLDDLQKLRGIGPKNAVAIKFVHEVARRFLREKVLNKTYVHCAKDVADYLSHSLSFSQRERVVCIYLDSANAILDIITLFEGTLDKTPFYPREILKHAIKIGAKNIILAHNHPSGNITPSKQDIISTKRLIIASLSMDIDMLDHIIIGMPEEFYSFEEHGLIKSMRDEALHIIS